MGDKFVFCIKVAMLMFSSFEFISELSFDNYIKVYYLMSTIDFTIEYYDNLEIGLNPRVFVSSIKDFKN